MKGVAVVHPMDIEWDRRVPEVAERAGVLSCRASRLTEFFGRTTQIKKLKFSQPGFFVSLLRPL